MVLVLRIRLMMLYITLYNYIYALYNSESYSRFHIFKFSKGNNYGPCSLLIVR